MYTVRNRYYKNSKISEAKFRQLIKHFSMDLSASDTARLIGVSVRSVNDIFLKLRLKMSESCCSVFLEPDFSESRFFVGNKVISGQRVQCFVCRKTGRIYTEILSNIERAMILPSFNDEKQRGRSDFLPVEITTIDGKTYAKDMASFWAYVQHRLSKFKGISKHTFVLHLKETEFRFNYRKDDLYKLLLKMIRTSPI